MELVFLDVSGWDYDTATPTQRPLGGSQSALCYLSAELARMGHRVTLITGTSRPGDVQGVRCCSLTNVPAAVISEPCDAFVVLNGPGEYAAAIRGKLHRDTPLVLWTQHASDQPGVQGLGNPETSSLWDVVVAVSGWHRNTLVKQFQLDPQRVVILRNAISPRFERLFASPAELAQAKAGPVVLTYTSTPFRGLAVLIEAFPALRALDPALTLRVFSSMQVYQHPAEADAFADLYERCRQSPGVDYRGSIPQGELAAELRSATVLAYPSVFAETSCIAVMEALAAGQLVVTSDLGALSETTLGYGVLAPPKREQSVAEFAASYGQVLQRALVERMRDPERYLSQRWEQVHAMNTTGTWRIRAREWERVIHLWREQRRANARNTPRASSVS